MAVDWDEPDEPLEQDEFLVAYLRLLHDYNKLRVLYAHARAAIDNDIFLADLCEKK